MLSALSHQNMEENLARYICSILQDNQQNSEVLVQDVQYIRAQVKIVKCTVNDIPVDISFNQTAGLSALCFLEKVDQLIGKDHLFKRSIILIKAWCYIREPDPWCTPWLDFYICIRNNDFIYH
ncbi:hypothetical protein E1A91_A05G433100v1 [Gossypium mustelinum]|uniref:PAP/OAS1 substrate-binding-related domain-containing protein n=1 Tax=Gossypium mustelinum TaxID=34275 RepID=A0A5D2ZI90_GOSMU|nr:hypothetical protein E1A91_A05G433100v1 [Gossypium mustelinum]